MSSKSVSVHIDNTKRRTSANDTLVGAARKTNQDMFGGVPASGDGSGGTGSLGTGGDTGGGAASGACRPPADPVTLVEDGRTQDEMGAGREVQERLTRTGSVFAPSLLPDFYRAVWFDGLEAYTPAHYALSGANRVVVPNETLLAGTVVYARYVVR